MNLKRTLGQWLIEALSAGVRGLIVDGFDRERRADTSHHGRGAAYAAAYAVFTPFPGNPVHGREDLWDAVLQMFDIVCEDQRPDGWWNWYVPATQKTHGLNHVWSMFSWLRLVQDFGERFGAERRERVERMLRAAMTCRVEGARAYLDTGRHPASKNIFAHATLALWLAGSVFDEPGWTTLAAAALDKCFATQFSDGYWPDANIHRGPTSLYNTVTLSAASAYARLSGSASALQAVRRAAEYHLWMSYPDGTAVETPDERNRYSAQVRGALAWSLAPFEPTRAVAAFFAERCASQPPPGPGERHGALRVDSWSSMPVDIWKAIPDEEVEPQRQPQGRHVFPTIPAAALNKDPWFVCLSGATTTVPSSHFHHDLQCHLSAWRAGAGLVIGGGNSLLDPRFSSFRFQGLYLASAGRASATEDGLSLSLDYGPILAFLDAAVDGPTLRLTASAQGPLPPDSEFAIHLPHLFGKALNLGPAELGLKDWAFWNGSEP
ncbi:MAG TPA: hypothetical protein P5137_15400, partial [Candidatus Brocadiia bacterium]|nr:hypothetical protein [Candidatus Brocadiia bacterium]